MTCSLMFLFFFFNDTATTEIYTLSLHDALPILRRPRLRGVPPHPLVRVADGGACTAMEARTNFRVTRRSEEHTSELQSRSDLVCRLLLEKKKEKCISFTSEDSPPCISGLTLPST